MKKLTSTMPTTLVHDFLTGHRLVLWVARRHHGPDQLQHQVDVGDFLCRPPRLVTAGVGIVQVEERRHALDVAAFLEEVLVGGVVLQQVEQQQETVFNDDAAVAGSLLHDDVQDPLKRVLKGDDLLNVGMAFRQLVQK